MVPCVAHWGQIDPLCRACTACYARLEDRPLGVWVGKGLKEEIAGGHLSERPRAKVLCLSSHQPRETVASHISTTLLLPLKRFKRPLWKALERFREVKQRLISFEAWL